GVQGRGSSFCLIGRAAVLELINRLGSKALVAVSVAGAVALLMGTTARPAQATIILEGSDAIGLHSPFDAGAAKYRDQVWPAIGASDPRTIAVIGTGSAPIVSTTHPI